MVHTQPLDIGAILVVVDVNVAVPSHVVEPNHPVEVSEPSQGGGAGGGGGAGAQPTTVRKSPLVVDHGVVVWSDMADGGADGAS